MLFVRYTCLMTTSTLRRVTGGDRDPRGMGREGKGGGEEGGLCLTPPLCHHHNDSAIRRGSQERHFNVSLIVRGKVTRQ